MNLIKGILFLILSIWGLSSQPLFAQEDLIKELLEGKKERKYALYASTLRMINISGNEEFNKMVNGMEKALVFVLDSATKADKSYLRLDEIYLNAGFEEYMRMYGGDAQMSLLGQEKGKDSEFVGYYVMDDWAIGFYMRGLIAWQKIPTIIQTMQDGDLLDVLSLTENKREKRPRNKGSE